MNTQQQIDAFGFNREITGLRLTGGTITKEGLKATIEGVTEIADFAQLDEQTWGRALMGWAFRLSDGNLRNAEQIMKLEYNRYWEQEQTRMARQLDEQIGFARLEKDKENETQSERIADKIAEVFGVEVFPGAIDGWSEKDRNEVKTWLAWHILKGNDNASARAMPRLPDCLAAWFEPAEADDVADTEEFSGPVAEAA